MRKILIRVSLLSLACSAAMAQSPSPVTQSVQKAIEGNPEVAAKFDVFRAARDEIGVAEGAYRPHLDLSAAAGRRSYTNTGSLPEKPGYFEDGARLELSQLLWDGLATRHEVDRLDHAKLMRYFEFLDTSEQIGLQAAAAYFDVVRYRKLVALAEDNYVQHKYSYDQVQSRVQAGVGRGVDLEQVKARVALAQSNLVTERANLHDVTVRYLRLVGTLPPAENVDAMAFRTPLPATQKAALEAATVQSPAIAAAIENLRAARAAAAGQKSPFQPRIEARVRGAQGHNLDGVLDQRKDVGAEIALTWNLFNGGTDSARERQYANLLSEAQNLRDKACNDVEQTTSIAWNDVRKLREQLDYLKQNVASIQSARDAYRQQFDIGQRSLLDLLNAENELYTAKHAYVMAEEDLAIAQLRTYEGMGTLLSTLGLQRGDAQALAPEAANWNVDGDASGRCPLQAVEVSGPSFSELDRKADALTAAHGTPVAAPPAPLPASAPVAAPLPPVTPVTPAQSTAISVQRLHDWATAWMAKDVHRYMAFYSDDFQPQKTDKSKWIAERRRLVTKPGPIQVRLEHITTRSLTDTRVETGFDQVYESSDYKGTMHKTLVWDRVGTEWKIVGETNR